MVRKLANQTRNGSNMSRLLRRALPALLLMGFPLGSVADKRLQEELSALNSGVSELQSQYLEPALLERRIQITARLNDGELLYATEDYDRAAMVLLDLVENPAAKGLPAYREALYYLADALFKIRNYRASARYFEELARLGAPREQQLAVGRLVEIALVTQEQAAAARYLEQAEALLRGNPDPALLYAVGKYRYELGDLPAADALFGRVPVEHSDGLRARYFQGVVAIRGNRLQDGQTRFEQVIKAATARTGLTAVNKRIVDLAKLGTARLHYEAGRFDQAVAAYNQVPQDSGVFDQALFEQVWIAIKRKDYERALRKLEVQLIVKPDVIDGSEARLLQAKLLMMLGRYDEAATGFEEVLFEFGPLRDEMRGVLRRHAKNFNAYLQERLGDSLLDFDPGRFLPEKAARFAGPDSETQRALLLVADLGLQHRDVREAQRIVEQLETALEAGSRVKIFPRLHDGWLRGIELRSRTAVARARLNDVAAQTLAVRAPEYAQLQNARLQQQTRFQALPRTVVELRARTAQVDDEMVRLDQIAFRLELDIRSIEAQLVAIDRYVLDTVGGADVAQDLPALKQVRRERDAAQQLRSELKAVAHEIEAERIRLGANDAASSKDDLVRSAYLEAIRAEARWLTSNGAPISAERLALVDRIDGKLDTFFQKAGQLVDDRVTDIRGQLARERDNVQRYHGELAAFSTETGSIGSTVAARSFRNVFDRIGAVVLEADVGLVDVAWKQKQDMSTEITGVLDRQTAELERLKGEFAEVNRD